MAICERCGHELAVGDFPFCKGSSADHQGGHYGVSSDECDMLATNVICNEDGSPRRYISKSAMVRDAAAKGFVNHVTHVCPPGTDKSKFTSRWI